MKSELTPRQRTIWKKHQELMKTENAAVEKRRQFLSNRIKRLEEEEKNLALRMQEWGKEAIDEELKNSREMARKFPDVWSMILSTKVDAQKLRASMARIEAQVAELFQAMSDLTNEVARRRLKRT